MVLPSLVGARLMGEAPVPVVVMGVSGSGKTTVAQALATSTSRPFVEGDALHSAESVAKMAAGHVLDDADRGPWLDEVGARLASVPGAVATCSALKRTYRDRLRARAGRVFFVHLHVDPVELRERLERRRGHFMPVALLGSQLALLEPLSPDEEGVTLDAARPVTDLVDAAVAALPP